jgi:addiction module RelE/StbE family toxin
MREIVFKKQFNKDVERIKRTGRPMDRLSEAIDLLAESKPLPPINRGSSARRQYAGLPRMPSRRGLALIYQLTDETVTFIRTGSHTELFG